MGMKSNETGTGQSTLIKPRGAESTEQPNFQTASVNNAFQRADGNWFVAVHGHNHLPPIGMAPFLMTSRLTNQHEAVLSQHLDNFLGVAKLGGDGSRHG
jgi:hypothetical protein